MPHVWSSPGIAAVQTPQAAEVCAHCGRCTSRTGHWILREPEGVGQTHAQCPLSRIFRRHFRPTIELLAWLSVVMALLATPLWLSEVRPALKKVERAALCWKTCPSTKSCWLMQALSTIMRALGCVHHALYACRPSLHVDGIPPFLVDLQLGEHDSLWKTRIF